MTFAVRPLALGPERQVPPANVLSMLHFDGANNSTTFTDAAGVLTWTRSGNAKISTAQHVFGGASGYFDGDGDYITSDASSGLKSLLTQSFTISAWVYPTAIRASGTRVVSTGGGTVAWNSTNGIQCLVQLVDASPNTRVFLGMLNSARSGPISLASDVYVPLNQWSHIVAQIDVAADLMGVGANGAMKYTALSSRGIPSSTPVATVATIPGEAGASTQAFQGYIDDLCVAFGVAQYTGTSYQVPAAPHLP